MIKRIALSFLWGILSAAMGYSVTTTKGFIVFAIGELMIVILTWKD
jgi:hypothetical protein